MPKKRQRCDSNPAWDHNSWASQTAFQPFSDPVGDVHNKSITLFNGTNIGRWVQSVNANAPIILKNYKKITKKSGKLSADWTLEKTKVTLLCEPINTARAWFFFFNNVHMHNVLGTIPNATDSGGVRNGSRSPVGGSHYGSCAATTGTRIFFLLLFFFLHTFPTRLISDRRANLKLFRRG